MHQNNLASLWVNFGDFWGQLKCLGLKLGDRVWLRVRNRAILRVRGRGKGKVRGFLNGIHLVSERGFQKVVLMHPSNC